MPGDYDHIDEMLSPGKEGMLFKVVAFISGTGGIVSGFFSAGLFFKPFAEDVIHNIQDLGLFENLGDALDACDDAEQEFANDPTCPDDFDTQHAIVSPNESGPAGDAFSIVSDPAALAVTSALLFVICLAALHASQQQKAQAPSSAIDVAPAL